ncbi:MAG TPA: hypothetical protein VMN82_10545 [Thermoanaerobaculia bacterium]|nr:hypothetical protein [Thermoanaerobaculia bacterium]
MRRWLALALFVAVVPTAGSLVPCLRPEASCCGRTCHSAGSNRGMTCCLFGADSSHPILQSCAGAVDGVPPAAGCSLSAPRARIDVSQPGLAGRRESTSSPRPIVRPLEVPDPVPLRLS